MTEGGVWLLLVRYLRLLEERVKKCVRIKKSRGYRARMIGREKE